ncbi:hypothetical protein UFOVP17_21 [uncultured Caudovirales phage]|uniref:Uncharacterized protein n=1 Tax=uncultured Caudovirales phage TaxID=2100421 RepID=A0A6J5KNX0_9CAUD|nr:hypothetical protein UFOVP17_21 [uncultured Caudovirales phage]
MAKKSDIDLLTEYVNHMIGKTIIGCGTNEDAEFEIDLNDGTVVVFYSNEDLSMVIDYSQQLN